MSSVAALQSGKSHRDENFPVASFLIAPRHRPAVLAFYKFVRAADDVADNPSAAADEKLALLEQMRASLTGESDFVPEGVALRTVLAERGLSALHALDLLEAFRRDCTRLRYRDWDELIDYCRYSAMPVGRFVLDVHGESQSLWPANDALCAALQVINHLQDCAEDYRGLDRVYLPQDVLAAHDASIGMLDGQRAPPALRGAIGELARRSGALLRDAAPLSGQTADIRLALEIAAIQSLAEHLVRRLERRDPLSESVHVGKAGFAVLGGLGILRGLGSILLRPFGATRRRRQ